MGLAVTFVLMCTNVAISLLKNVIPGKLRIPIYMIVFATFVTITDMMMEVYAPALHKALGIFVPLIVVNCVILARAEMFARKNSVGRSILDGLGTGLGFTLGLSVLAGIREVLGNGTLLDYPVMGQAFEPVLLMMLPAGGFFVLGFIVAALKIKDLRSEAKKRAQTVIPHS
jgi:electron transport complex protein RnfE